MSYQIARNVALNRDRICQNCGTEENLHAHHIVPRSEGGPDTPENLVILCKYCHPKFEGSRDVPRYAGGGVRIDDVVTLLETQQLSRMALKELRKEHGPFKLVQRDPGVCNNCFRRYEGVPPLKDRLTELTHQAMSDHTIFQDQVQGDSDICDNCFRRTHDRYERNYRLEPYQRDDGEWDVRGVEVSGVELTLPGGETELLGGMDDEVYRKREATDRIPEKGGHRGMRTVCECGFRWGPEEEVGEWKNRPLDKKTFFEYAQHLIERLRENDIELDEDEYWDHLDEMKSDPDEQFADDRIYEAAIERASVRRLAKA